MKKFAYFAMVTVFTIGVLILPWIMEVALSNGTKLPLDGGGLGAMLLIPATCLIALCLLVHIVSGYIGQLDAFAFYAIRFTAVF